MKLCSEGGMRIETRRRVQMTPYSATLLGVAYVLVLAP